MNRLAFHRLAIGFLSLLPLPLCFTHTAFAQPQVDPEKAFKFTEIDANVWLYTPPIANGISSFVFEDVDGLILLDTQRDDVENRDLVNALRKNWPGKPLKQLIITSLRVDHWAGIPFLQGVYGKTLPIYWPAKAGKLWNDAFPAQQRKYVANGGMEDLSRISIPSFEIKDGQKVTFGDYSAKFIATNNAESPAGLAVWLDEGKTLLLGELFDGGLNFDTSAQANWKTLVEVCEKVRALPSLRVFSGRGGRNYSLFEFDRYVKYLKTAALEYSYKMPRRLSYDEFVSRFQPPLNVQLFNPSETLPAMYAMLAQAYRPRWKMKK